jgi:hypothetical protein
MNMPWQIARANWHRGPKVATILVLLALLLPGAAHAFDCGKPAFSQDHPAINLRHIFCGEIRNGRPDGYHAEIMKLPTASVVAVRDRREARNGVATGTVLFTNGATKFSSFFPRRCTEAQIITSIRYAISQPRTPKPGSWGFIAPSAPIPGSDGYCLGTDGAPFTIRYATLSRGDINTAFPD